MMGIEIILFVLFWAGVLALAIWLIPGLRSDSSSRRTPLDIARERYAHGEISKEQFEQIAQDLRRAA